MQMIIAVDPGTDASAYVVFETSEKQRPSHFPGYIVDKGILDNDEMLDKLLEYDCKLYIEMIASYGMPVGKHVFETCVWIGRFIECHNGPWEYVYRKDVKMHLCNSNKAKDANIRQAILDQYGGTREKAIGTKNHQGPLYGVSKDIWAALGVALTATYEEKPF